MIGLEHPNHPRSTVVKTSDWIARAIGVPAPAIVSSLGNWLSLNQAAAAVRPFWKSEFGEPLRLLLERLGSGMIAAKATSNAPSAPNARPSSLPGPPTPVWWRDLIIDQWSRESRAWKEWFFGGGILVDGAGVETLATELRARQPAPQPGAAHGAGDWSILATLAWIATKNLGVVDQVMANERDPEWRHCFAISCLRWATWNGHCQCNPKPADWLDCNCIRKAHRTLKAYLAEGTLRGSGQFRNPDRKPNPLMKALIAEDLGEWKVMAWRPDTRIRPHQVADTRHTFLAFANNMRSAKFDAERVRELFPVNPRKVTDSEIADWIENCGTNNSKAAWDQFHFRPEFTNVKQLAFFANWRSVYPDRGRGRPSKV